MYEKYDWLLKETNIYEEHNLLKLERDKKKKKKKNKNKITMNQNKNPYLDDHSEKFKVYNSQIRSHSLILTMS
jgi:hypothetical protein